MAKYSSKNGNFLVASLQLKTRSTYEENLNHLITYIQNSKAEIIVAPELCLTNFDYEHFEEVAEFYSIALERLLEVVGKKILVLTMTKKRGDDFFNEAIVIYNHQVIHRQAKYKLSKPWINMKLFRNYLSKFQELVLKESDSKIIYLSLPMVSSRVSSLLHGIEENIIDYKQVIDSLVQHERISEIDIDILFKSNMEKYNQEGIHYSAKGHQVVFDALYKKIKDIQEKEL